MEIGLSPGSSRPSARLSWFSLTAFDGSKLQNTGSSIEDKLYIYIYMYVNGLLNWNQPIKGFHFR